MFWLAVALFLSVSIILKVLYEFIYETHVYYADVEMLKAKVTEMINILNGVGK